MTYYPSYAIFTREIELRPLARLFVEAFGESLTQIGLRLAQSGGQRYENKVEALAGLAAGAEPLDTLIMASDHHRLILSLADASTLEIEFYDFGPELSQAGAITPELRAKKRKLALAMHRLLLTRCQAALSFTSNFDQKYAGEPDLADMASFFRDCLSTASGAPDFASVNPVLFWLFGFQRSLETSQLQAWLPVLREEYLVAEESPGYRLLEYHDPVFRPGFLE